MSMLHAKVSYEADYITPDSNLGNGFQAMMLERYLDEHATVLHSKDKPFVIADSVMAPIDPKENLWVISDDSGINDELGGGFRIKTPEMHHLMHAPTALVNLTGFIRQEGITDASCKFLVTYHIEGLQHINPLKFLLLLDEIDIIEVWSKFGRFQRKSHTEYMAAVLQTNRYWHDNYKMWVRDARKHTGFGDGYSIDFGYLSRNKLVVNFIQGPHYEHRANAVAQTIMKVSEAIQFSLNNDPEGDLEFHERARDFFTEHVNKVHPQARYTVPGG